MKKLFTLLSLFLCFASGAWAINTNGAMNGVFSVSSTKQVKLPAIKTCLNMATIVFLKTMLLGTLCHNQNGNIYIPSVQ